MSDQHRHQLEIKGYNDLLAEHCEISDRVAALETAFEALNLRMENMGAELRALGCVVSINFVKERRPAKEIIADLGHGWQIIAECATDGSSNDGK